MSETLKDLYTEPEMQFNEVVHVTTENGDPDRKEDGSIQLKTNWKKVAEDRQGRTYNKHVHGDEAKLDNDGFLKVRRRDPSAQKGDTSRSEAFVAKYYEKGYAFYIANDDGGRLEQMTATDWEPVMAKDGSPASMNVGQARSPNTQGRLFRKPEEWYKADQEAKIERNKARFEQTRSPKEDDGQYEATPSSPLR
ncbi:hypothetical protein LCGC14_1446950 [marine sediment metagenome]|uniref:Uncharacterized protein n=1 Tax=marine sediment metagenome TaxID=412755 RepID=A0A0F9JIX2_9ZZZZ